MSAERLVARDVLAPGRVLLSTNEFKPPTPIMRTSQIDDAGATVGPVALRSYGTRELCPPGARLAKPVGPTRALVAAEIKPASVRDVGSRPRRRVPQGLGVEPAGRSRSQPESVYF
jgi:hypothetical protein